VGSAGLVLVNRPILVDFDFTLSSLTNVPASPALLEGLLLVKYKLFFSMGVA